MSIAIIEALPELPLASGHGTMLALADIIERTVGGTSSAIYCIFLSALGAGLSKYGSSNVTEWAKGNTTFPVISLSLSLIFLGVGVGVGCDHTCYIK